MNVLLLAGKLALSDEAVYVLALCRGLRERGHGLHLLTRGGPLAEILAEQGFKVREHGLTGSLWRDVLEQQRLQKALADFPTDVLHAVTEEMDAAGHHVARALGIPRVTAVHGRTASGLSSWRQPDAVLVPGQGLRATVVNQVRIDRTRVHVVPYGLPTGPEPGPRASGRPVVGAVGPLRRGRGLKHFIRAMARVRTRRPDALFPVVGTGPYHRFLVRHVEALDLADQVVICEPSVEPADLMAHMDVVVFPSLTEEFGCLALLAMTLGRPVVASAMGAAFDLLRDEEIGFLVPPGDVQSLATRVLHLLEHPEEARAMGQRARLAAESGYSPESMLQGTENAYRAALEATAAARGGGR